MNRTVFTVGTLIVMVAACVVSGYLIGSSNSVAKTEVRQGTPSPELQEILLKAETASAGSKIAMATASIDGDVDVIYALDFESGNLMAWLPGPNQQFLGEWGINVSQYIGLEKGSNPDLVMTVGNFNFRRGNTGAIRDVPLICYVANGENGQVAGFGFQWNPQLAKNGKFQRGVMVKAYEGTTRQQTIKRQ